MAISFFFLFFFLSFRNLTVSLSLAPPQLWSMKELREALKQAVRASDDRLIAAIEEEQIRREEESAEQTRKLEEAEKAKGAAEKQAQAAEKQAQAAEKQAQEEKEAKEAAEKVIKENLKSIVDHGLPPMLDHCVGSPTDGPSIPKEKDHKPAELMAEVLPDPKIVGAEKDKLSRDDTFSTWLVFKERGLESFEYSTEDSLKDFVGPVLRNVEASLRKILGPLYSLQFETELRTFNEKADYWVLLRGGKPVGVVEIKKSGDMAMDHPNIFGECFDYMMKVRSFDGLDYIYCILTTYNEWRFLCLEDTVANAKSTVIPDVNQPRVQGNYIDTLLPNLPSWVFRDRGDQLSTPGRRPYILNPVTAFRNLRNRNRATNITVPRRVYATRVFNRDDPALIEAIAAIFIKMATSPATKLTALCDHNRPYRLMGPGTWEWATIASNFQIDFEHFPMTSARNFILLLHLGMGNNGHVYLASTRGDTSGAACVLKFPILPPERDEQRRKEMLVEKRARYETEATGWHEIWNARGVRVETLYGQPVLMMPYFKMCKGDVANQSAEAKDAVKEAIQHMAQRGYRHNECRWEHIGLYRRNGETHAVLIDLGNISKISKTEAEQAAIEMRTALGL